MESQGTTCAGQSRATPTSRSRSSRGKVRPPPLPLLPGHVSSQGAPPVSRTSISHLHLQLPARSCRRPSHADHPVAAADHLDASVGTPRAAVNKAFADESCPMFDTILPKGVTLIKVRSLTLTHSPPAPRSSLHRVVLARIRVFHEKNTSFLLPYNWKPEGPRTADGRCRRDLFGSAENYCSTRSGCDGFLVALTLSISLSLSGFRI